MAREQMGQDLPVSPSAVMARDQMAVTRS